MEFILECKDGPILGNICIHHAMDSKEIKPVNPGDQTINTEYSLEGLTLKRQYFDHLMQRANSLEMTLMLGKIEGRRRRGRQRMRWLGGIIDTMDVIQTKSGR